VNSSIRHTIAHIDLSALRHNYRIIQEYVGSGVIVLAPVKGMAYGHGAIACAQALEDEGCNYFGVALVEEGKALRDAGIRGNIICLSGTSPRAPKEIIRSKLTPVLYDLETATSLNKTACKIGVQVDVHLKIDTGMGRLGVSLANWPDFLKGIKELKALQVKGICTHYSDADIIGSNFTHIQTERFNTGLEIAASFHIHPELIHASNSAAALSYPKSRYNMVRTGIALYGVSPRDDLDLPLKPVMSIDTEVLFVKKIQAGEGVSYGGTWKSITDAIIATLPIGYADGYPRSLSNLASVEIKGHRCPIRGRVCMDLLMVDVSQVPTGVRSGDRAVLLGGSITVNELASLANTIPYEILTSFFGRIPRNFINEKT